MITTKAAAKANIPGMPTSSANPVFGKPVGSGVTVMSPPAFEVNRAARVRVGSIADDSLAGVSVATTTEVGLEVVVGVLGAFVAVIVGVSVHAAASAVIPLDMATDVFWAFTSATWVCWAA
jgi:hypothetical protein